MSLFAEYFKEFYDDETYECEDGFAVYRYLGDSQVYIVHIYVAPERRRSGVASAIADKVVEVAKLRGCNEVLGSVVPSAKHSTASLKVLLGYGMRLKGIEGALIIFHKEI